VVYVAYFPSDSVLVERGDALWFCAVALVISAVTMVTEPLLRRSSVVSPRGKPVSAAALLGEGLAVDLLAWGLAIWMVVAALASCPPGNLRQATNEAWLWVAGAAMLSSARRLLSDRVSRVMILTLFAAVATGLAVQTLHQEWISLPKTRADYLADPDAMLKAAGVDAPRGSAQRMVFANRLLDGGPTATFALANSLAAVLIVACLIPIGLLLTANHRHHRLGRIVCLALLALVAAAALLATRSRSALAACLLGAAWIWLVDATSKRVMADRSRADRYRKLIAAALGVAAIGGVTTLALMMFGDAEWMSAAPASLEFRLQYWKATIALLADHPLIGAGPGGFQSLYLRYRLPVANETIADPHNFFFETVAAGGWIAGAMLIVLLIAIANDSRRAAGRDAEVEESSLLPDSNGSPGRGQQPGDARWIGIGAGASLGLVWLFALLAGRLPDFEAGVFAVPIAISGGWLIFRQLSGCSDAALRSILAGVLMSIMIHLLVSGGWTVPGVAIFVWLTAACLCPAGVGKPAAPESSLGHEDPLAQGVASRTATVAACVGIFLLLCLRFESLVPSQNVHQALARAEEAARRGIMARAESESRRAVEADGWAFEAPLWRSELLKNRLVEAGDEPSGRKAWLDALQTVVERSGDNPLVLRTAGEQHLHVYQRYGAMADLEAADSLISKALAGNPTEVSLVAQASMLALERGELAKSLALARQARRLSQLGDNIVRDLGLQQILVVEKVGPPASRIPLIRPIKDQFGERLSRPDEPVQ
jgi:O-antigen ligase